ncbi:MAG: hypothetical protein OEU54_01510 [Gemmatimonadota bacterium]|nr:hypothetical protein [Gemmatimonadota bacterium]
MSPRFEMKAIRSWTLGRRDRAATSESSIHGDADEGAVDLSTVLEAYDRRFESAAAEERTEAERHEQFRAEASRLLETVIGPTLVELGTEVRDHGHGWSVESRVDILGQPALACAFSPRDSAENGIQPNELSFRFASPDRMMVAGAAQDGSELQELPPRSYHIADVTVSTVAEEVTRFITRVLS